MPPSKLTVPGIPCRLAAVLTLLASVQLHGQAVSPAAPPKPAAADEPIQLTPFEVSSEKDVGYAAGNTLSGGRVDTPLAITPGSISVMTKEFLEDFNITDMNQAGAWTIGMDLGTPVPHSDPTSISTYQNIFRGAPSDQNFPTRNGSINFGVADSYNSERFEFARGPDSSMFGDGGPGGRQGSSSKRGRFNSTATSFSAQFDTNKGYRGTFDFNKGWDRFALRVNGLRQNNKAFVDAVDRIKNAATINAAFKVSKNTLLIAEFERVGEWNDLYSSSIMESVHYWDSTTINDNNTTITNPNSFGLEQFSATNDYFVWNFATNRLENLKGNQYRTRGSGFRIPWAGQPYLPASRRPFLSSIDPHFTLRAKDNDADRDSDTFSVTAEHRVGNLFMRLNFVRNNFDSNTPWSNFSANDYRIDVNKLMPDGRLNPRFLQPFVDVEQNRIYNQDAVKEYSGLATYRFFIPKFYDYKQQFSFNGGFRETGREDRTDAWRRVDNPLQADPFNVANTFRYRLYYTDPRPEIGPILTDPSKVLPGKWQIVDTAGSITKREVTYASLVSQTAFFNEKLAITGSIRRDNVAVDSLPRFGSSGTPNFKNVLGSGAAGVHIKREKTVYSTAFGVVTYPFPAREGVMRKWLSPLGFVFNFAENNQAPGTNSPAPLISGEEAPLTHSKTMDLGLRYSIPGGKAYLTVSHYNTDQEDLVGGFGSQGDIRNIWLNLGYTDPKLTTAEFSYSDLSARKLEGWEVELTANPTRNLTLTANYSHPVTYIQSESVDRKAYVAEHMAEWKAGSALANGATFNGRTILDSQLIRDALLNIENSLNGLTTGALENNQARHRINFAASYRFREGRLAGLGLNSGINYRGYTKSGSRDARIKFGIPDSAPNPTALQNAQAAFDYLWTPPTYTVSAGANYTRRFGKYNTRFQVNVTNLLDDRDPIWGRSGALGTNAYVVLTTNQFFAGNPRQQVLAGHVPAEPRKISFSTTVSF